MTIWTILMLAAGLVALYYGAEWLVHGSASIAARCRISPLVVGLTVVAYGTSAPELLVSLIAGFDGKGDIAIGNVVGSNIFNIALILGLSALVLPLKVHAALVRWDVPVMIGVTVAAALFLLLGHGIGRLGGALLLLGGAAYSWNCVRWARRNPEALPEDGEAPPGISRWGWGGDVVFILGGLVVLVLGSKLLVVSAVTIAKYFGLSEAVIGLTIIAAGTSLPELATSVVASFKKQSDIAIGNIVGSNIFNILFVLGGAATVCPLKSAGISLLDIGMMLGVSVVLLPFMRSGLILSRKNGAVLLLAYIGYIALLLRQ